jgi:signal transduction histidine kinase
MSLYQKGLLAFALVILVAVTTVLLLVSRQTETGFRQYALLYSGRAQNIGASLLIYYQTHGSWDGVQAALPMLTPAIGAPQGQGRGDSGRGGGQVGEQGNADYWNFRVANASGEVIAQLTGAPDGPLSRTELARALPLSLDGVIVGYLLPDAVSVRGFALGGPEEQYLRQVRLALWTGAVVAFLAALLVGGLLMGGIVAPVRRLTHAAEQIAQGDLQVPMATIYPRTLASRDEIGQLGRAFNTMAESLVSSQATRQAQTADIAHELRNPLAVLRGTLEAIADGVYAPTPENIDPALAQVQTLTRLVDDLHLLALADAGELHIMRQPIALRTLLSCVVEAHRVPFEERGLDLTCALPTTLPDVSGDSDRLAQVVGNLLANALHHVPRGGRVHLTAAAKNSGVVVSVIDHGPGVAEADLPRLFERFWRGDPSRSRDTGGSGLGLAIARRIVEAHNGRIWAEATPGGGLTAAFWLPELRAG